MAAELQSLLGDIRRHIAESQHDQPRGGSLVSVIKSVGGVGATMVATQTASLHAKMTAGSDTKIGLFDLDLQFGSVGLYLGVQSPLTVMDLIQAGSRVDGALLSTVTIETATGLRVVAAPDEITPIEAANLDQILRVVEQAQTEMNVVYLDLPGNWTNWSLSLVLRSDVVLLLVDLTIASLRQARRQIELLRSQGIEPSRIRVVANRVERRLFRSIGFKDAEAAINHSIAASITGEPGLVTSALNQGILIEQMSASSRVARDLRALVDDCVVPALQVSV
jgi:pilus assembly protein CpaE